MRTASPTQMDGSRAGAFCSVGRCARCILFALLLAVPTSSWAISLYDVVQLSGEGYSDEQIIKLINVTHARFELDADRLVTLKEAGVSESVIQALIKASPTAPASFPETAPTGDLRLTDPAEAHRAESSHGQDPAPTVTPSAYRSSPHFRASAVQEGPFSSYPFEESGMGHGDSHQHYALAVEGLSVLILRSEAGRRTIAERAREVTGLLNQVTNEKPGGLFFASREPDAAVWYRTTAYDPPLRILRLGRGDVIAYQRRSLGAVSKERLAAYWAALLNDYTQLFIYGRAPRELVELHLGEALSRVYEQLSSPTEEETDTSLDETTMLPRVLDHLTGEDKEHLLELATRVPAEFRENAEVP